jgi:hypothetical protein
MEKTEKTIEEITYNIFVDSEEAKFGINDFMIRDIERAYDILQELKEKYKGKIRILEIRTITSWREISESELEEKLREKRSY